MDVVKIQLSWHYLLLLLFVGLLSQPQLNLNSTQPNITKVGFDTKTTYTTTTTTHRKLNISNISTVLDPILTKL